MYKTHQYFFYLDKIANGCSSFHLTIKVNKWSISWVYKAVIAEILTRMPICIILMRFYGWTIKWNMFGCNPAKCNIQTAGVDMSQQPIINEPLWCYRDAPTYKSHPDIREHACLVQVPAKFTLSFLYFFQWKGNAKMTTLHGHCLSLLLILIFSTFLVIQ